MTGTLVRISPLLRELVKPAAIVLGAVNLMLGVAGFLAGRGLDVLPWTAAVLWGAPAGYLAWTAWGRGELEWELTLPLRPVLLWRAQLIALMISAVLIWSVGASALVMLELLARKLGGDWVADGGRFVAILAASLCGVLATAAWVQGRRRDLRTFELGGVRFWLDAVMFVGIEVTVMFGSERPTLGVPILLALIVGLILESRRRVPRAWLLHASADRREVEPAGTPGTLDHDRWRLSLDWRLLAIILRSARKGLLQVVGIAPLVLFFGAFLGGLGAVLLPGSELHMLFLPITAYCLIAGVIFPLSGLRAVDALPVSRTRVFAGLMISVWACLLIGYGIGGTLYARLADRGERFAFVDEPDRYGLMVPFDLFELAVDGNPPELALEDGSTFAPFSLPVLGDGGPVLWKPYATPRGCTPAFAGRQLSRALEVFYGESPPAAELAERYFAVGASGDAVLKGEALSVAADYPDLEPLRRDRPLPVAIGLLGLLWILPAGLVMSAYRSHRTRRFRMIATWGVLGLLLVLHTALFVGPILMEKQPDRLDVAFRCWMRGLPAHLPGGEASLWGLALLIVAGATFYALRRFHAVDATAADISVSLAVSSDEGRSR